MNLEPAIGFAYDGEQLSFSFRPFVGDVPELNFLQQGRLFCQEGCLIFESGPSPLLWPEATCQQLRTQEVWAQDAEHFSARLLHVPAPKTAQQADQAISGPSGPGGPLAGWNESWQAQWATLPVALFIEIEKAGRRHSWPIWLSERPIVEMLVRDE